MDQNKPLRRAIAIDFDGTICTDAYPNIGIPKWPLIELAIERQKAGDALILWTCREGKYLDVAVAACEEWGLHFDAVNSSLPEWIERYGGDPRKVGASEYWDDRAISVIGDTVKWFYDAPRVTWCGQCAYSTPPAQLTQKYGTPGTLTCRNRNSPCNHRNVNVFDFCSYAKEKGAEL